MHTFTQSCTNTKHSNVSTHKVTKLNYRADCFGQVDGISVSFALARLWNNSREAHYVDGEM